MLRAAPIIIDDLDYSLFELSDVLKKTEKVTDPREAQLMEDARLYAFLQCYENLEELLSQLFESSGIEVEEDDCECDEGAHALALLLEVGVISEHQYEKLSTLREHAEFFAMDRTWMDENDAALFDAGTAAIANYYYVMCAFLKEVEVLVDFEEDDELEGADLRDVAPRELNLSDFEPTDFELDNQVPEEQYGHS